MKENDFRPPPVSAHPGFWKGGEIATPLSLFDHRLETTFLVSLTQGITSPVLGLYLGEDRWKIATCKAFNSFVRQTDIHALTYRRSDFIVCPMLLLMNWTMKIKVSPVRLFFDRVGFVEDPNIRRHHVLTLSVLTSGQYLVFS